MAEPIDLWRSIFGSKPARAAIPPVPLDVPYGPEPPFTPITYQAPPVENYPTPEDAEYARRYGFGANLGNEANTARIIGRTVRGNFFPQSIYHLGTQDSNVIAAQAASDRGSRNLDLRDPQNAAIKDTLGETLTQAALAANRIPIAALGFDPSRIGFDVTSTKGNLSGSYVNYPTEEDEKKKQNQIDTIYSDVSRRDPSSPIHESIHRGIAMLKADPKLAGIFRNLPAEEYLVRYIMARQAGDPEAVGGSATGDDQRKIALRRMEHPAVAARFKEQLDALDLAAQEAIKNKRQGGPR